MSWVRRAFRSACRLAGWSCLSLAALSVLLHLTVRDSIWPLSAAFYGFPCWVAAGAALTATFLFQHDRSLCRASAVVTAMLLIWSVRKDIRPFTEPPHARDGAASFEMVMWNPFFGGLGWERVAEQLRDIDADVICMVEGGARRPQMMEFWAEHLPDYNRAHCGYAFIVLSKHPVRVLTSLLKPPIDDRVEAEVLLDGQWVRFVLFHPKSKPLYDRSGVTASLVRRAEELSHQPTVLCGDFNLPTNSAHLAPLRQWYHLASDSGGTLFRPTWPAFFPVLTLDQIWCGGGLRVIDSDHEWTTRSDHRPVVARIELPPRDLRPPARP